MAAYDLPNFDPSRVSDVTILLSVATCGFVIPCVRLDMLIWLPTFPPSHRPIDVRRVLNYYSYENACEDGQILK